MAAGREDGDKQGEVSTIKQACMSSCHLDTADVIRARAHCSRFVGRPYLLE